jgi:hypothetical protein
VIHGVQHSMHPPVHMLGKDDGQKSFLVFITRELDRALIEASLTRFLKLTSEAVPAEPGELGLT